MLKSLSDTDYWSTFKDTKFQVQPDLQKQAIKIAPTNNCESQIATTVTWPVKLKAKEA